MQPGSLANPHHYVINFSLRLRDVLLMSISRFNFPLVLENKWSSNHLRAAAGQELFISHSGSVKSSQTFFCIGVYILWNVFNVDAHSEQRTFLRFTADIAPFVGIVCAGFERTQPISRRRAELVECFQMQMQLHWNAQNGKVRQSFFLCTSPFAPIERN